MTSSAVATAARTVDLTCGCAEAGCLELAWKMRRLLDTPKYRDGVSIMDNPASLDEWRQEHRTARKRADRSERLGYMFREVDLSQHSNDVYEINTSLPARQGRPMSDGYRNWRQQSKLPEYPCDQHNIRTYGVISDEPKLVAYLTLYRVGELGLISMILGHGDHLASDIMYLLVAGMVGDQAGYPGSLYYNRHDSGTDGLRYFKTKIGFREGHVEWV